MMPSFKSLALAVGPFLLVARASVDFDLDDAPASCKTICGPIGQLSDKCDTDILNDSERDEKLLEAQCVCTNKSFDVAKIAALCADCIHQSAKQGRGDGDLHHIDDLLATCGFSSTTYSTAATSEVQSISVVATAATNITQLTTTLTRGTQSSGTVSGSGSVTSGPAQTSSGGSSSTPAGATTAVSSLGSSATGSQTKTATTSTSNAAPGVQPLGGVSASAAGAMYVVGAIVAGGWAMLR